MAVGYDDDAKRFFVRNSWGPKWGRAGYFMMPYDYCTNPNLASDFWTIRLVEVERPRSTAEAEKNEGTASGGTKTVLRMKGELENGKLVLHCTSPDSTCPDETLIFEKANWDK